MGGSPEVKGGEGAVGIAHGIREQLLVVDGRKDACICMHVHACVCKCVQVYVWVCSTRGDGVVAYVLSTRGDGSLCTGSLAHSLTHSLAFVHAQYVHAHLAQT